jgi:hypothetical protein
MSSQAHETDQSSNMCLFGFNYGTTKINSKCVELILDLFNFLKIKLILSSKLILLKGKNHSF